MDERYPIGDTDSATVFVLRHEQRGAGYPQWSAAIGLRGGEATVVLPGHYAGVLAQRLRAAERFRPPPSGGTASASPSPLPAYSERLGRDEYLDLTALSRGGEETLALSSTARSPARVTLELPRAELAELAELLESAQELIETLRQGVWLVPDSLPESL